ncbi:MAG: hypothetical protein RQ866_05290, partial [Bacteroidales bacterium]|nr:hypothetical protein [Bacteroidales bacterium]
MTRTLLFGMALIMLSPAVIADNVTVNYKKMFYNHFISSNLDKWVGLMALLQKQYIEKKSKDDLLVLAYARYGYIGNCFSENKRKSAEKHINKLEKNVEQMLKKDDKWAEAYALKGALYGYKIEFNKWKTIDYGLQSINNINKALELDPASPYGWVEKANANYYMPKTFGGGIDKAIKHLEKAIRLFEKKPGETTHNWLYLLSMTNLGRWYE